MFNNNYKGYKYFVEHDRTLVLVSTKTSLILTHLLPNYVFYNTTLYKNLCTKEVTNEVFVNYFSHYFILN
jgi:hypothetical protein